MRTLKWIGLLAVCCLAACNITVGQCWIDENGNGAADPEEPGAGGGPAVPPGGTGDNGDDPGKEPQDAPAPPVCESIGQYSSTLFKFKTTIEDDLSAPSGGWQEARPTLKFVDDRQDPPDSWSCTFTFGIPLRTVAHGKISASKAADIAAEASTFGSSFAMHKKASWVPQDFCNQFVNEMKALLSSQKGPYWQYGARVNL